jgi:hypothetical protein
MDQRTAKREACFRAALCLDNMLSTGWEGLDDHYGDDADKVREAMTDIVAELTKRGGRVPQRHVPAGGQA